MILPHQFSECNSLKHIIYSIIHFLTQIANQCIHRAVVFTFSVAIQIHGISLALNGTDHIFSGTSSGFFRKIIAALAAP